MDVQSILQIMSLLGTAFAVYLGLRRLPGEIRHNEASTVNEYASAASITVATNKVLQERIDRLQKRLDDLEKVIDLKDARIEELEGITRVQEIKIEDQSRKITVQEEQILKLQAQIKELQNGTHQDLS